MSYFSSYCAEVQDYLKACEHLLEAAHIHNRQFSEEELQMVESYSTDVAKSIRLSCILRIPLSLLAFFRLSDFSEVFTSGQRPLK